MNRLFNILTTLFLIALFASCSAKKSEPWNQEQLMPPEELAGIIKDSAAAKPLVVCIGPGALIKGSVDVGQTGEEPNLEKLRGLLAEEDRDKAIVLYCGCCPFEKCPNIRPAFTLLNDMKFTNHRLLNLSNNLKTDWIEKGYPVEDLTALD
ncbi:hypothetical protein EDD80_105120 [Anseongella ginsenosidimutans]|uniref:Rhodanese domain-containing protein n=1 Tax=Anseongella ginsenosidimutans TaxID=496056 RepID=A0A4V2UTR2_9SPHI|nr:rhodanese-like domain-containing protein [Anseongella ginsenosidimutans]QEC52914.1 rhodanese-like domain-containing protein [Anseongella ginsenosidimutans]TCS87306.1 hypothetical protein EDD80_105120 [Anseongella ginsenosidimutans]